MTPILLTTILTCQQVKGIVSRLIESDFLTPQQKVEVFIELHKVVPTCPLIIQPNVIKK